MSVRKQLVRSCGELQVKSERSREGNYVKKWKNAREDV